MFKNIKFKSVGELIDYVLDGNELYHCGTDMYLKSHKGHICWNDCVFYKPNSNDTTLNWRIKIDWRDTLKDKPVLCWVNDSSTTEECDDIAIISHYNEDKIYPYKSTTGSVYLYANPVSSNELDQFIIEN